MQPPYYAVVFTSQLATGPAVADYGTVAERMVELAAQQPGFLGVESARGSDGIGITVSYWQDRESIAAWRRDAEHLGAQRLGRERFYSWFRLRVALVERETTSG
ncbi:MAG: antibiotic biosynthesis monooxygenase [Planctomycetota bacterium]